MELNIDKLTKACEPGGSNSLRVLTELAPAGGEAAGIAPARFLDGRTATYAYERRFVDGEAVHTVLIDGKASSLNRIEEQIATAIADGLMPLSLTPRITVTYPTLGTMSDLEAPHRCFDGHFRIGTIDGVPAVKHDAYIALRNSKPSDALALLQTSPASIALGAWDSTRKSHQSRFRSPITGEIIGILADQDQPPSNPRRGGARTDHLSPSVRLSSTELKEIMEPQRDELGAKTIEKLEKEATSAKNAPTSGSHLGVGSIPPALNTLGLVSCRRIIRQQVLSFAALRQLRFGKEMSLDGTVACRALLAAWTLNGLARSNSELVLRANCDLVEKGPEEYWLDARHGKGETLTPLDITAADALLTEAIDNARKKAGVRWEGQVLEIVGNPIIDRTSEALDEDEDENKDK
ncbi:MAG: type I-U CRISPR-associated protein Cas7 [Arachnia propionica]|uniref:type I-G CRISPR-associated protein Cas7 n=1 Tax=Arachnia propionica TaxID=1750 RepID=UPI00270B00FD|nr:type I-U CRISPR-associated protein Cas7 [Arachnia propionica]